MNAKVLANVAVILLGGALVGFMLRAKTGDEVLHSDVEAQYDVEGNLVSVPPPIAEDDVIDFSATKRDPKVEGLMQEFTLTERSGKEVSSESLLGRPYIVSFFFTRCPSICMQQNRKLEELQNDLPVEDVRLLAISVDPEFDRPEVLREYAARFDADPEQWLFLTGPLDYIRRIGSDLFQQPVNQQFHTERFALVDGQGDLDSIYSWNNPVHMKRLKQRIAQLADESLAATDAKEAS